MLPNPNDFQSIDEFLKAVSPILSAEGKTQQEIVETTSRLWNQRTVKAADPIKIKSKFDLINDFRKQIEKNNLSISDDQLVELFQTISSRTSMSLTQLDLTDIEQEIKILPKKRVWIQKYKTFINLNDVLFGEMIRGFSSGVFPKVFIDVQHDLGVKYADIISLENKNDGLYAKIKLNGLGIDAVKFNKYSYVSPDWSDRVDTKKVTHKNVLRAVTLTNVPALQGELPPIQDQIRLSGDDNMNEFEKRLALIEAKLKIITLQDGVPAPGAIDPEALNNLLTMANEMVVEITKLTGEKDAAEAVAETVTAELTEIKTTQQKADKEIFFNDLVKSGKVKPGKELDDWMEHYDSSEAFTRKILSDRPVKNPGKQSTSLSDDSGFTAEDREIAESSGYDLSDDKDVKKFKQVMREDI